MPVVIGLAAVGKFQVAPVEIFPVHPVGGVIIDFGAIADSAESFFLGAGSRGEQATLGVLRVFGDDIDDAIDRVGAPEAGPRAADDLDPFDVIEHGVLGIPEDSGKKRVVQGAAIHEHQKFVGGKGIEAPAGDRPFVGVYPRHLQAGHHAQYLWKSGGARALYVFLVDHKNCGRRFAGFFGFFGNRGNFHGKQLFKGKLGDIGVRRPARLATGHQDGDCRKAGCCFTGQIPFSSEE